MPLLLLAIAVALALPAGAHAQSHDVTVSRIVDGDTLDVTAGGQEARVRIIGIDAPESVDPNRPVECGGREAAERLAELAPPGTPVRLTLDPSQGRADRYGRLLAYVERGSVDLGLQLVGEGRAEVLVVGAGFAREEAYRAASEAAERSRRGIWGRCTLREEAEALVRSHYRRVNDESFGAAWALLAASARRDAGGYAAWRGRYRRHLGTRVNRLSVEVFGSVAAVRVAIRTRHRDACSGREVRRWFRVRWGVRRSGGDWRLTSVSVRQSGGGTLRLSRAQCPKPKRKAEPRPRRQAPGGGGGCHPSYTPCVPAGRDHDCGELDGPYSVHGPDEYRLDADGDGVGCE